MNSKYLQFSFVYKEADTPTCEEFYPFGNLKCLNSDIFILWLHSPSEYYYSDIFGAGILTVDEAWDIYIQLMESQQDASFDIKTIKDLGKNKKDAEVHFKKYYLMSLEELDKDNIKDI